MHTALTYIKAALGGTSTSTVDLLSMRERLAEQMDLSGVRYARGKRIMSSISRIVT